MAANDERTIGGQNLSCESLLRDCIHDIAMTCSDLSYIRPSLRCTLLSRKPHPPANKFPQYFLSYLKRTQSCHPTSRTPRTSTVRALLTRLATARSRLKSKTLPRERSRRSFPNESILLPTAARVSPMLLANHTFPRPSRRYVFSSSFPLALSTTSSSTR